jgi:hypothetical protein
MGKRAIGFQREIVAEAARLICEERLTDYRMAKHKAAERLGLPKRAQMPNNALIEEAVIEYQRLFGGNDYAERLVHLRRTAVRAMRLLSSFEPRLVGAVATGATTDAHLVRLHGFAEKPEMLDIFLQGQRIPFETGDRRYRYSDGRVAEIPTCEFLAGDVGVEMAVFPPEELRRPPLSPIDGMPMKRLTLDQAQQLLEQPIDIAVE